MKKTYGYARVSSKDQNVARQLDAILAAGVKKEMVFIDHESGRDFNRPAWKRLCARLRPGDGLVVQSLDRIGRNYRELLEQWRFLTYVKKATVTIIDAPFIMSKSPEDLTQRFLSDIMLQLLSYVAETERVFIKRRQAEGIASAKVRGVKFGAPRKIPPDAFPAVAAEWSKGLISKRIAAKRLNVSRDVFDRWMREC
ncbi:MAG: recombinase family protein [Kiritimatiellae bacterium]|nr:recombinase family protein [Kiritimatiellia bacterium]